MFTPSTLERTAFYQPAGFRWIVRQHCDTGKLAVQVGQPNRPDPKPRRGFVLLKTVIHNPAWDTRAKILNNILP